MHRRYPTRRPPRSCRFVAGLSPGDLSRRPATAAHRRSSSSWPAPPRAFPRHRDRLTTPPGPATRRRGRRGGLPRRPSGGGGERRGRAARHGRGRIAMAAARSGRVRTRRRACRDPIVDPTRATTGRSSASPDASPLADTSARVLELSCTASTCSSPWGCPSRPRRGAVGVARDLLRRASPIGPTRSPLACALAGRPVA